MFRRNVNTTIQNKGRYRKMKLLMHTCCAPCSVYCIDSLRSEGIETTVYWYNPNIHPYMEYKARRDCLKEYTQSIGVQAIFEEEYGLDKFCKNVIGNLKTRCTDYCYRVRLEQTAKYAKEKELQIAKNMLKKGMVERLKKGVYKKTYRQEMV